MSKLAMYFLAFTAVGWMHSTRAEAAPGPQPVQTAATTPAPQTQAPVAPVKASAQQAAHAPAVPESITEDNVGMGFKYRFGNLVANQLGFEYNHRYSDHFMIGATVYTGQLTGTSTGSMTNAGLQATYFEQWGSRLRVELSLNVGACGGINNGTQFGGTAIEPGLRFNIDMGGSVRVGLNGGFLIMPASVTNAGLSAGIKFEFYNLFSSKPILNPGP